MKTSVLHWTDAEDADLAKLWHEGWSASQIARRLHVLGHLARSRNAIIGRVHRIGLPPRATPDRLVPKHNMSGRKSTYAKGKQALQAYNRKQGCKAMSKAELERAREKNIRNVARWAALATAEPDVGPPAQAADDPCRWPFGDPKKPSFYFCGAPIARGAYCAAHHARAYKVVAVDGPGL